jgi:uncharacterized protein (DUF305 family)
MMARSQMRTLAATSGQRFDFLFVDMLVEHHKGAIVMSDEVLADGRDAESHWSPAERLPTRGGRSDS